MRTYVQRSEAMILVGYFLARCGAGKHVLSRQAAWVLLIGKKPTLCSTIGLGKDESFVPFETASRTCGMLSTLMSKTGEGAGTKTTNLRRSPGCTRKFSIDGDCGVIRNFGQQSSPILADEAQARPCLSRTADLSRLATTGCYYRHPRSLGRWTTRCSKRCVASGGEPLIASPIASRLYGCGSSTASTDRNRRHPPTYNAMQITSGWSGPF